MSNEQKPEVRQVPQPAVAPQIQAVPTQSSAVDVTSSAFQAAVAAAVQIALAQQAPAAAPATSLNEKLMNVLLAKEAREASADHERQLILANKQVQAGKNAQSTEQEKREKQRRCKHIKGGKLQKKGIKDWNVSSHTFVDGEEVIKCQSCGMRWRARDTKEFLYRGEEVRTQNGLQHVLRKYRNHTGIGWHEAKQMLEDSTNTPTRSEIVMTVNPQAAQASAISETLQKHKTSEIEDYGKPVEETVQQ